MENLENLARAAGQGDRQAFARLVGRTQADVWRFARALTGDDDLAGDVTQETYARAIRSLRGFRGDGSARSFLLTIARRVAADEFRARQPRFGGPENPVTSDPAGQVVAERLLIELPIRLREAFVLTQVSGLSYEETAAVLDCPVGTVRSRVFRARQELIDAWRAGEAEHA